MSWPTGRGEAALLAPTRHSACHRCSFGRLSVTSTEDRESVQLPDLVAAVRHAVALPVIAAGGIATAADVTAVLRAGAVAAMVGTVLLRTRRADPTGAQAAAAALAASDGRSRRGTQRARQVRVQDQRQFPRQFTSGVRTGM
ncbi:nitronate monooxygenase [Streptomyces sp. NPDC002896]|uniref:nitronate monooxygenase n=1 Tax=Streptomyces sp. NPDC002896 TaxID=3154438 RepID=UPI00332910DC